MERYSLARGESQQHRMTIVEKGAEMNERREYAKPTVTRLDAQPD